MPAQHIISGHYETGKVVGPEGHPVDALIVTTGPGDQYVIPLPDNVKDALRAAWSGLAVANPGQVPPFRPDGPVA